MDNITLNHLAIIVAALSAFLIGGLWYSPMLFSNAWMRENNFTRELITEKNKPARTFGLSFIFSLVMAYNLGFFLGDPEIDAMKGMLYGFLTGFGWVAMAIFIIGMFEFRSWTYLLINGGYMIVAFTVMGLIIGAWR